MKKGKKLADFLEKKANELNIPVYELSKLIKPGSSGSFISSIKLGKTVLEEKNIMIIANFFKEEPIKLSFMAGRVPKIILKIILEDEKIQEYLIREVKEWEKRKTK